MSLAHAILVSLVDCPQSGYDLAKKFDGSVGFFWKATHQQIYRELTKLEELRWLTAKSIIQAGRPDKKLFSLTDLGIENVKTWISQPCEISPSKEELLVKIYAGHLVSSQLLVAEIKRHQQLHQEKLEIYQEIERQMNADSQAPQILKYPYLTLRMGIKFELAWIDWCDEAIATLSSDITNSLGI
jgi:DNA-binding PadR family transcriptional regulator